MDSQGGDSPSDIQSTNQTLSAKIFEKLNKFYFTLNLLSYKLQTFNKSYQKAQTVLNLSFLSSCDARRRRTSCLPGSHKTLGTTVLRYDIYLLSFSILYSSTKFFFL